MRRLFESKKITSLYGDISVEGGLGRWRVVVGGTGQTTPYTNTMWKEAFKRVASPYLPIKNILMLGLGAGGGVPLLHRQFPGCRITAVEHDPAMLELARELALHTPHEFPQVLLGDAAKVVAGLSDAYDLIVLDLFNGPEPSSLAADPTFLQLLCERLSAHGTLLINVYRRKEHLAAAQALCNYAREWRHEDNFLGAYRRVPAHFVPPEFWPEYGYTATPKTICAAEEVGGGSGPKGIRWSLWPLTFEEYTADEEPDTAAASKTGSLNRNRAVVWQRFLRTDTPKGWRVLSTLPWRVDGYHELDAGYEKRWHKSAQRKLAIWRKDHLHSTHEIEQLSWKEFKAAYAQSTVAKKFGLELLRALERKLGLPSARHITLWGVRDKQSGAIVAGTGILASPTYKSSLRECPFILPEAKHCHAMTGLMDHWHSYSLKNGVSLLVFTHFRQKGDPRDWRGFSDFKSHFITGVVEHPPALWRFVRGKLF